MPKTKDAFAFRNFDETRILQRPYFRQFNLPNQPDAEIIQSLQVADDDTVDDIEKKINHLDFVLDKLVDFYRIISRHLNKLGRYKFHKTKPARNDELLVKYFSAQIKCADLTAKINRLYDTTEKAVPKIYRKVFTDNLKKYRQSAGMTQKELGDLVNVSPQSMSRYALGQLEVPLHILIRIARALNVTTDKLLGLQ